VALVPLVRGGRWYEVPTWRLVASVIAGMAPAAVIACGALITLLRRLPGWGYSWAGAALMGTALLVQTAVEELAEGGRPLLSPAGEVVAGGLILLAGLGLLVVAALRGTRQAGLVSIGFAMTIGLVVCSTFSSAPFYRDDLALLAAPLGLAMAALTYAFARGSTAARAGVLAAVGLLNAGLAWTADRVVFRSWVLSQGKTGFLLPLLVVLAGVLLAGPLLGLAVAAGRRALGRAAAQ
jgi:hypothetical protein